MLLVASRRGLYRSSSDEALLVIQEKESSQLPFSREGGCDELPFEGWFDMFHTQSFKQSYEDLFVRRLTKDRS